MLNHKLMGVKHTQSTTAEALHICTDSSQTRFVNMCKVRQRHNIRYTRHADDSDWHLASFENDDSASAAIQSQSAGCQAECVKTVTRFAWVRMMAYSKSLQHSLSNTASSHCAHNLVLQIKGTAPKQASAAVVLQMQQVTSATTSLTVACIVIICHSREIAIAANGISSNDIINSNLT